MPSTRKQLNVRLPDAAWELFESLVAATGLSQTDVVVQGLRCLARREGVDVPALPPKRIAKKKKESA